ncbi:DEAD/DEAH box helicase [Wenzhouxiangella sp. C33]|uniref:DEAD/DEAH box helicase n=2 Tax=Wenzhouxiangella limi TaxID=2707351 RepID=A0A845UWA3_9GAMM|nr:DEAD/DEAH box helicase [Wenzhouxiangella limi]
MDAMPFAAPIAEWFKSQFDQPTRIQRLAWPQVRRGKHCLIAAGTGQGKSLAALLPLIDRLLAEPVTGRILYVAPLRALSNNMADGLLAQLGTLCARSRRKLTVAVRTGDTPGAERRRQLRRPPDLMLTTPESLFVMLGSAAGRRAMSLVSAVIVDELHALGDSKRGAHLALSLERLSAVAGPQTLQRVGLSATARPLTRMARFLVGNDRECEIVHVGAAVPVDVRLEIGPDPLQSLAGEARWRFVADRIVELVSSADRALIFCNTRALVERLAATLTERLGDERVAAHHGSLGIKRRTAVEQGLRDGRLSAVVCSSSLELGVDIGELEQVIQIGSIGSVNALRQRAGRSRHRPGQAPRLHLFPLTLSDLLDAHALIGALARGRIEPSGQWTDPPVDVLAQQLIAMVAAGPGRVEDFWPRIRRAAPCANLSEEDFAALVDMLHDGYIRGRETGRGPLRKGAGNTLYPAPETPLRSRLNVGTIPEWFDYEVVDASSGQVLGRLDEEFAFESAPGQVFQLGGRHFSIQRIVSGRVEVRPSEAEEAALPFWFGEGPGRSASVSLQVCRLLAGAGLHGGREDRQLRAFLDESRRILGVLPGWHQIVLERFPDPGGDEHIVVHSPFGLRLNRAWGLALRKRFCRQFNFELQAVATDNAVLISLGATHSFPLAEVIGYLRSDTLTDVLIQAVLDTPQFATRFRWCATTALAIDRRDARGRVPAQIQRNQAENLIARIFPDQLACLENLSGPRQVPDHPLTDQALQECLCRHMDLPGLIRLYQRIESGRIGVRCVETSAPSPLAQGAIHAPRHAYLDPADAEERRTRTFEDRRRPSTLTAMVGGTKGRPAWSTAEGLEDALQRFAYLPVEEAERAGAGRAFARLSAQRVAFALSNTGGLAVWVHLDHLGAWLGLQPDVRVWPHLPTGMRPDPVDSHEALCRLVLGAIRRRPAVDEQRLVEESGQNRERVQAALASLQHEGLIRQPHQDPNGGWSERSGRQLPMPAGCA